MTCILQERHESQYILFASNMEVLATLCKPHGKRYWELVIGNEMRGFHHFKSPAQCLAWLNGSAGLDCKLQMRARDWSIETARTFPTAAELALGKPRE